MPFVHRSEESPPSMGEVRLGVTAPGESDAAPLAVPVVVRRRFYRRSP